MIRRRASGEKSRGDGLGASGMPHFAWQPRYYDRIVRDERAFHAIRRYILANPARWHERHR